MTRQEMIDALVARDIESIKESLVQGDTEFLSNVLSGEGWIGYRNLNDAQLAREWSE